MAYATRVEPGSKVDLDAFDTRQDGGLNKEEGEAKANLLGQELDALQDLLYAAGTHAALVVLQGMDTAGKDGTIRKVFGYVDPLGCHVWPFKVPTSVELAHDFLWRAHAKAPEKGYIAVFNRSHYEDVLVVRVDDLVPDSVWKKRYGMINDFESLLSENQTIVVKFMLHISQKEQAERLQAREQEVEKAWKLSADDWRKRDQWDAYMDAYEDALENCSKSDAPWYIVPADRKWFRDLAVLETLVETLRPYRDGWLETLRERGDQELAAIAALQPGEKTPVS